MIVKKFAKTIIDQVRFRVSSFSLCGCHGLLDCADHRDIKTRLRGWVDPNTTQWDHYRTGTEFIQVVCWGGGPFGPRDWRETVTRSCPGFIASLALFRLEGLRRARVHCRCYVSWIDNFRGEPSEYRGSNLGHPARLWRRQSRR